MYASPGRSCPLVAGAYLRLCLFYKGAAPSPDLRNASALELATLGYGVGNHLYYSGRVAEGVEMWRRVLNTSYWAAFGFIAAEAELQRLGLKRVASAERRREAPPLLAVPAGVAL